MPPLRVISIFIALLTQFLLTVAYPEPTTTLRHSDYDVVESDEDFSEDLGRFMADFFQDSRAQLVLDLDLFREIWQELDLLRESALEGDVDHIQSTIDFLRPLVEHSPKVSAQCLADLFHFFWTTYNYALAAKRGASCESGDCNCTADYRKQLREYQWIFDVVDSVGKVPAAIVGGNILWTGSWQTCRKVSAVKNEQGQLWQGQYCMVRFYPYMRHNPLKAFMAKEVDPAETCSANYSRTFDEWSDKDKKCFTLMPLLNWGVCTPDSCTSYDTAKIIEFVYTTVELAADNKFVCHVDVQCSNARPENLLWNDNKSLAVGAFLLAILGLIIFGTCYEWYVVKPIEEENKRRLAADAANRPSAGLNEEDGIDGEEIEVIGEAEPAAPAKPQLSQPRGAFVSFILWFALGRNLAYIMDTSSLESGQIRSLHGARFLAMAWVMFGHTYYYICTTFTTDNLLKTLQLFPRYFYNQMVVQAPLAVDAFFFLSGLLTTYIFLGKLATGRARLDDWRMWLAYYIRRYLRLTPVYVVIMMLEVTLFTHISEGPFWRPIDSTFCRNSWWANLLYINNFVKQDDPCMGWTWYLANDFQLYASAPVLIIALHKFKWKGVLFGILLIAVSCCINLAITIQRGYPPAPLLTTKLQIVYVLEEYWRVLYVKPYIRCVPYIVGALTGYYLLERRAAKLKLSNGLWLALWTLTLLLGAYSSFGLYHFTKTGEISEWYALLYTFAGRPAFAFFLALITYLCESGNGGALNSILAHKIFIPLSKLTFCVYLLHPILLQLYYLSRPSAFHFTHSFQLLNMFFAAIVSSYLVALGFSLTFEMPVLQLDKLLFGGGGGTGGKRNNGEDELKGGKTALVEMKEREAPLLTQGERESGKKIAAS